MSDRQSYFKNNDYIRPRGNMSSSPYSPNPASSFSMRPPYRPAGKYHAKNSQPISSEFSSRFHEPSSIQTSRAADTNSLNYNVIHPRDESRHKTQASMVRFPNSNQFSKIPCNLPSVQSSESYDKAYSSHVSNVSDNVPSHWQSSNQSDVSGSYSGYENPSHAPSMTNSISNLNNKNYASFNQFAQPPPASNAPNYALPCYNAPDVLSSGSSNVNTMMRLPLPNSSKPDFVRQPMPAGFGNPNSIRQPSQLGLNIPNFIRQPPPTGFINTRQPLSSSMVPQQLPSNNLVPNNHLSFSLQTPPPVSSDVVPFAMMSQDSQLNVFPAPNLSVPPPPVNKDWLEEKKLNDFMGKFSLNKKSTIKADLTVIDFSNKLKEAFATVKKLAELKEELLNSVDSNENDWNKKLKEVLLYKDKLKKECDFLSEPKIIDLIQEKLKSGKRKRALKRKIKLARIEEKAKKIVYREELHQTIDKWLESIKEKNLKLKREAEMKKEADSILAEVRRKIHEAKRTIEKIKVFEKLRTARHANAAKKGLFLPDHDQKFEIRITDLKSTLFKQLTDYEREEKALKVMLEAEQEGQLEEEALWRIKKLKTAQQRRQKNIITSLFGNEEDPTEEDPLFLFHQFHSSGHKSIENLVQIRGQWDMHLNKDGESIPLQWVVPVEPSSSAWEVALES